MDKVWWCGVVWCGAIDDWDSDVMLDGCGTVTGFETFSFASASGSRESGRCLVIGVLGVDG